MSLREGYCRVVPHSLNSFAFPTPPPPTLPPLHVIACLPPRSRVPSSAFPFPFARPNLEHRRHRYLVHPSSDDVNPPPCHVCPSASSPSEPLTQSLCRRKRTPSMSILIALLRNDLRILDHPIWYQAHFNDAVSSKVKYILPVYCFDERQIELGGIEGYRKVHPDRLAKTRVGQFWKCGIHRTK